MKTRPLLISLAGAALSLMLFAWLAEEMLEGDMTRFDTVVRQFVHSWSSPRLTIAMQFMAFIGSPLFVSLLTAIGSAALWIAGRRRKARTLAITVVGGSLLMWVLKISFHRPRPTPFFDTPLPSSWSFPSGHALLSFCFFGIAAALFNADRRPLWLRTLVWTLAALLVASIGLSRIYLGVHYPSDVVAGYLGGFVWLLGVRLAWLR
jgi:undecaprenyl-diphosphatase